MNKPLSNCCKAEIKLHQGDECTNCFLCSSCNKACDPYAEIPENAERTGDRGRLKKGCYTNMPFKDKLRGMTHHDKDACYKCKMCGDHFQIESQVQRCNHDFWIGKEVAKDIPSNAEEIGSRGRIEPKCSCSYNSLGRIVFNELCPVHKVVNTSSTPLNTEEKYPEHICRFNDYPQVCKCYEEGINYMKNMKPEENKELEWERRTREDFQDFSDSILWSNDAGDEKYIGVGNMADWWVDKIKSLLDKQKIEHCSEPSCSECDKEAYKRGVEDVKTIIQSKKTNERKVANFGEYEARTYDDKMLVNAVLDDLLKEI